MTDPVLCDGCPPHPQSLATHFYVNNGRFYQTCVIHYVLSDAFDKKVPLMSEEEVEIWKMMSE